MRNFANNYATTLNGTISDSVTSFTLTSATGAPTAPFDVIIGSEIIYVGARSGTACSSCTRGAEGTTAVGHTSGDTITHIVTAAAMANVGAFVLLEQHTAASSATLDFTTAITSLYDVYQFEMVNLVPASDANLHILFSTNGGSSYLSANYKYGIAPINDGGSVAGPVSSTSDSKILAWGTIEATASLGVCGTFKLFDPLNASYGKAMTFTGGNQQSNGNYYGFTGAGFNTGTTAVNAVRFLFSTGNIATGTIRVYGLAK